MMGLLTPNLIEMWVACGTKAGKSVGASAAICSGVWLKRGGLFRWVAPIYSQAKIGFKYCQRLLPNEPHVLMNKSELSLYVPRMDSKIEFRSGKFPEDLEGEACSGYINDECAKMQEAVYDAEKTTLTVTRGPMINISTPRGKNWFYTKCMQAKDEMEWCIKNGKPLTRVFITAPSVVNNHVTIDAVMDAKKQLPDRLFRQYYLAEFVDDGTVFGGFRDCLYGEPIEIESDYQRWFDPACKTAQVVIGVDWAKQHDRTVFTAIDMVTRRVIAFERFYKTPYTEAVRRLVLFSRKFQDVIIILHDKTGIGNVIDDQLAYTSLPAQGIVFTNQSKADMVSKLITAIEQKSVFFPNWNDLIDEIDAYELTTTPSGLMSYNAPSGQHDDIVCSLMLSHLGLIQYGDRDAKVMFIEDLVKDKSIAEPSTIEQYYNSFEDDDD